MHHSQNLAKNSHNGLTVFGRHIRLSVVVVVRRPALAETLHHAGFSEAALQTRAKPPARRAATAIRGAEFVLNHQNPLNDLLLCDRCFAISNHHLVMRGGNVELTSS